MKKFTYLIAITLITIVFNANAQLQKGNVLIGSDMGNLTLQLNASHIIDFSITPKAAWFVQDNLALGGYVNFGLASGDGSNTVTTYGVGALGRYYTGADVSVLKHGRFFVEGTAGIGGTNVSGGGGNTNGLDIGVGPGFSYFVTSNIGLETMLKYNGIVGFGSQTYQNSLGLTFGLQIYLPGKATIAKVGGDMK
jgi:hypothetical protein